MKIKKVRPQVEQTCGREGDECMYHHHSSPPIIPQILGDKMGIFWINWGILGHIRHTRHIAYFRHLNIQKTPQTRMFKGF
jgi:hypothetical protein